jgi:hypothetical protein
MVKRCLFVTAIFVALVQAQVQPKVAQRQLTDEVNVVRVAPRFATAIRMPEPVSSVVVGDPSKFLAEHSEKEQALVLVEAGCRRTDGIESAGHHHNGPAA